MGVQKRCHEIRLGWATGPECPSKRRRSSVGAARRAGAGRVTPPCLA